jgi:serine/threonine-protein kinase
LWVSTVNKHLNTSTKNSYDIDTNVLIEAGLSTTNKTSEQLEAILKAKFENSNKPTNSFLPKGKLPKKLLIVSLLVITLTVLILMYGQYTQHKNEINSDNQAWTLAKKNNTTDDYTTYLQQFPTGNYITEAKKYLADLLRKEKILTASKDSLRQQQIINAQQQLINLDFQVDLSGKIDLRTTLAVKAFEQSENLIITGRIDEFLLKKLTESYQKKDTLLWEKEKLKHSIAGYQKYYTSFPKGLHVNQAINAIKQLKIKTKKIEKEKQQTQEKKRKKIINLAINKLFNNLLTLPSGKFNMGCNQEVDCKENENPIHTVFVKSFRMMATEATFTLWDACVISGDCNVQLKDEGWGRGNRPVIGVSYFDIIEQFIPWLNKATGEVFSLPSEAQWEYAAKAGSNTKYGLGKDIDCLKARFSQFSGICGNDRKTSLVKSFTPNEFGLYDMNGNVWEWTQDCWHNNYRGAPNNGSAWANGECDAGVIRGGSWLNQASFLRTSVRGRYSRSARSNTNGFRLVINAKD